MFTTNLGPIFELVSTVNDPNHQGVFGNTLLHAVVEFENCFELVLELIHAGANVNMANFFGITPLHCAVIYRNHSAFNTLIEYGALINARNYGGNTALHYSISNCMSSVMHQNCSHLIHHQHFPDKWIIRKLLQLKTLDINAANTRGETPLMWAVSCKQLDVVRALLEKAANVNVCDCLKRTPLHVAITQQEPNLEIIFELLVHGACIYCYDNNGDTPGDIIVQRFLNPHSGELVGEYAKLIALMHEIGGFTVPKLKSNSHLSLLLKKCCKEVLRMKNIAIAENLSLFDILYKGLGEKSDRDVKNEIYKTIIEILMSGVCSVFCDVLLNRIPKLELCRVLVQLIFSKKDLIGSKQKNFYGLFSNIIINCCISEYLSKTDMFNIILALCVENDGSRVC